MEANRPLDASPNTDDDLVPTLLLVGETGSWQAGSLCFSEIRRSASEIESGREIMIFGGSGRMARNKFQGCDLIKINQAGWGYGRAQNPIPSGSSGAMSRSVCAVSPDEVRPVQSTRKSVAGLATIKS
jgi:hypothetical protein